MAGGQSQSRIFRSITEQLHRPMPNYTVCSECAPTQYARIPFLVAHARHRAMDHSSS